MAPDVFGNAYEYLIKRFADQSNKKAGEYYTPRSVVGLLINILNPVEGKSVYDPACGTGGMLIEVIEHVKAAGGSPKTLWGPSGSPRLSAWAAFPTSGATPSRRTPSAGRPRAHPTSSWDVQMPKPSGIQACVAIKGGALFLHHVVPRSVGRSVLEAGQLRAGLP